MYDIIRLMSDREDTLDEARRVEKIGMAGFDKRVCVDCWSTSIGDATLLAG
jgi:hypothetical protein